MLNLQGVERYDHQEITRQPVIESFLAGIRSRFGRYGYSYFCYPDLVPPSHVLRSQESSHIRNKPREGPPRARNEYVARKWYSNIFCLSDYSRVQFIDLCILLGCDYLDPIKGIGPKSALKLIREHDGLEGVVEHLREKQVILSPLSTKIDLFLPSRQAEKEDKAADAEEGGKKKKGGIQVPEEWPWQEAKKLFEKPDVLPASEVEVRPHFS